MSVESNTVQIRIDVQDTSAAGVQSATANLTKLGEAGATTGAKVATAMNAIGTRTAAASAEMERFNARVLAVQAGVEALNRKAAQTPMQMFNEQTVGFSKSGMSGLEAQEAALANVQKRIQQEGALAAQTAATSAAMRNGYGEARIAMGAMTGSSRMMEMGLANIIAKNQVLAGLWNAALPIAMGVGMVAIIAQMAEGVYNLYEKWMDLDRPMRDYEEHLEKLKTEDFTNVQSIETAKLRIDEAADAVKNLSDAKNYFAHLSWGQLAQGDIAGFITSRAVAYESGTGTVDYRERDRKLGIKSAEEQHVETLLAIQRDHTASGYLTPAQQASTERQRTNAEDTENLKYKAAQEGLYGNDVSKSSGWSQFDMKEAIAENTYKRQMSQQDRQDTQELTRIHREADEASLTGIAKLEYERKAADADFVRAHGQNADALADIDRRYYADEIKGQEEASKRVAETYMRMFKASEEAHDHEIAKQQEFTNRVNSLVEQAADRQVQGFARIRAEADRQVAQLQSQNPGNDSERALGTAAIRQGERGQVDELQRRNAAEDEQLEDQARAHMMSAEKNQTAAIEDELRQRLAKYQDELQEQLISQDDYNRRAAAAYEQANAQMVEAARQAREKMAGEFTSFFRDLDHPLKALAEMGDKVAGQAAAALTQRLENHYGSKQSPMTSIYDKIAGVPSGTAQGAGQWGHGSAGSTMSVASAQILVSSGTILLGGGPGARGSTNAGGASFGSGTSSGAPGFPAMGGGFGGAFGMPDASAAGGPSSPSGMVASGVAMPPPPSKGAGAGGVMGDLQQGMSLFQQGKSIFSPGGESSSQSFIPQYNENGDLISTPSGASGGGPSWMGGSGADAASGAFGGGLGLLSSYESGTGGVGGTLSGAMSGMELGMAVGGPIGAAIGAVAGAALGLWGHGGREKARVYDLKEIGPHIAGDFQSYQTGGMNYMDAYSDLQSLDVTAERTTKQWGSSAHAYYNDTIRTEIAQARGKMDQMERGGRSDFGASGASYATGSDYVPSTGMALVHEGERITPSDQNERITRAIEGGADSSRAPVTGSWGGDVHLHVHAIDTKTGADWLMSNKHVLRSAVNQSYAENSGGADGLF